MLARASLWEQCVHNQSSYNQKWIPMLCYVMLTALYKHMCYVMTCHIAAGCYVNCVLGYDNTCYLNMLHVLSCTFLHEKNNIWTTIEIQDIQPSTRPRIKIYHVPAGKSCISVCFLLYIYIYIFFWTCLCFLFSI